MLNLFGKKKTVNSHQEVAVAERPASSYPKEVQEIHHEFENAGEKLLEEAYRIIGEQPVFNKTKIERLQKFGFSQVKENIEASGIIKTIELSESHIQFVKYYKKQYPHHKFITQEQVKAICHKYNLVCGDVSRFIGFVPEKNLNDLENFKLKKDELENLKIDETYERNENSIYKTYSVSKFINDKYPDSQSVIDAITSGKLAPMSGKYIINDGLKICAPVKDMDISGLELKEGYKLERKIEIPDPVVLQPVEGGYLILTAWGDEASDPLVMNENHN